MNDLMVQSEMSYSENKPEGSKEWRAAQEREGDSKRIVGERGRRGGE